MSGESNQKQLIIEKLKPFLNRHSQETKISEAEISEQKKFFVENPWVDESVMIILDCNNQKTFDVLNRVILPERLSAIYHTETKCIEFIYTAYKLRSGYEHVSNRRFKFKYKGNELDCWFGKSSDDLLEIAGATRPVTESTTGHRNLQSFATYVKIKMQPGEISSTPIGEPISFFVKEIEWDEEFAVDLARNLTFYMLYLDRVSPFIIVHPPRTPNDLREIRPERESPQAFPSIVTGRAIDDILLQFYEGCIIGGSFTRFLNAYRIIEYASLFYVEEQNRNAIRRALAAPDALSDLDRIIDKISSSLTLEKGRETNRIGLIIKACVGVPRLCSEMNYHKAAFSVKTAFDGGFSVTPLMQTELTEDNFPQVMFDNVTHALKNVRNALSHGRDQATALCITPSHHNMLRLRPWADLARTVAEEVMVYKKYAI